MSSLHSLESVPRYVFNDSGEGWDLYDLISASYLKLKEDMGEGDLEMLTEYVSTDPKATPTLEFIARTRLYRKTAVWQPMRHYTILAADVQHQGDEPSLWELFLAKQYWMVADLVLGKGRWGNTSKLQDFICDSIQATQLPIKHWTRDCHPLGLDNSWGKARVGFWGETYFTEDLGQAETCLQALQHIVPSVNWKASPRHLNHGEDTVFFNFIIDITLPNAKNVDLEPFFTLRDTK